MPNTVEEAFTIPSECDSTCQNQYRKTLNDLKQKKQSNDANIALSTTDITTINNNIAALTATGTSTPDYNSKVNNLVAALGRVNSRLSAYRSQVIDPSARLLSDVSTKLNINARTTMLNEMLSRSASVESELVKATEDLSTAHTREATIDTKDDAISYNQTWGYIARPLKRNTIPILIVFTLLFFGIGVVGLWFVSPYAAAAESIVSGEVGFFQHPAVWMTLVILGVVALILGAMKLGKQL